MLRKRAVAGRLAKVALHIVAVVAILWAGFYLWLDVAFWDTENSLDSLVVFAGNLSRMLHIPTIAALASWQFLLPRIEAEQTVTHCDNHYRIEAALRAAIGGHDEDKVGNGSANHIC